MFGAGTGDPGNVHFLEGVIADQVRGNLPGDDHHGNRIHVGGGDAGHGVGGARPGGDQANPGASAGPGISVRGVHGALFVTDQDMPNVGFYQFIIDIDDGAARKTKNGIHALFFQYGHQNLGSGHFHGFIHLCVEGYSTMAP